MLNIGRRRRREHPDILYKEKKRGKITSISVANFRSNWPTRGALRNLRLRMRTPFGTPMLVTFGHRLPWYILYYYTSKKKNKMLPGACISLTWIKAAFNNNATALWRPSWWESASAGDNFGRGPCNDYSLKVWF